MKHILESEEAFTAYATIDAALWMLNKLQEDYFKPLSPIEQAVDVASGYDKERTVQFKKKATVIINDMIAAKKVVGVEYENDEAMLIKIKAL